MPFSQLCLQLYNTRLRPNKDIGYVTDIVLP